jgi:hypothetical protein
MLPIKLISQQIFYENIVNTSEKLQKITQLCLFHMSTYINDDKLNTLFQIILIILSKISIGELQKLQLILE